MTLVLPLALIGLALAALLMAEQREHAALQRVAKPLASLGFLWLAWRVGAGEHDFGRVLFVALVACALGDVCLLSRRPAWFLAGLSAFLIGHAGYAWAFASRGVAPTPALALAAVLALPAWAVLRWLRPFLEPGMRVPVLAYVVAITAMLACAWTCDAGHATPWIRAGATAFYLSDLAVARDVFVRREFFNRAWGLPLYYGAQVCIAIAASR
ncbi:MAG: lysoplasmalogenase [Deltaproteobacteria bacterium]|nr:lysoplasmalogenase [Deltaproteobacteria bacterium]MBP7290924.1 lysoplasmalogenase [Nannocystaceae bacterium]